jgi:hypothetical protein
VGSGRWEPGSGGVVPRGPFIIAGALQPPVCGFRVGPASRCDGLIFERDEFWSPAEVPGNWGGAAMRALFTALLGLNRRFATRNFGDGSIPGAEAPRLK